MVVVFSNSFKKQKLEKFLNKTCASSIENENKAYRHHVKADALRIKNYFWESIEEYLLSIKYNGSNSDAYKGLGYSYKQIGYTKSAIDAFNSAKKLSPFEKELYFEAGCCYCIEYNFQEAIKEYQKALKLCPEFLEASFNIAFAYELEGFDSMAMKEYEKIILNNPEHLKSYNNLASLYMKLNMYKQAIKTFKRLLRKDYGYSRAYLGLAICFDKLKDKNIALRYYKKYLTIKPNSENLDYILERISELNKEKPYRENIHLKLVS